jgi:hypothetical protein
MSDTHYLVNLGPTAKYLGELAKSKEIGELYGDEGQRILRSYIDTMARKGGVGGAHVLRWLDTLRRNVGIGTLGFRLSSIGIQPSSLIDAMGMVGPTWALKGALNIATSKEWRKFVLKNMQEIRDRMGDDPAFLEFGMGRAAQKAAQWGYWPLEMLDRLTAASVAAGVYEKILHKQGRSVDFAHPDQEAINEAELLVRRTQASGTFGNVPLNVSRGTVFQSRSLAKAVYQFQTFTMNKFSLLAHDMIGEAVANGNVSQASNILVFSALAFMAEEGVRMGIRALTGGTPPPDESEEKALQIAKEAAIDFATTVPMFGQALSAIRYSSVPVPVISTGMDAIKAARQAITGKAPETKLRGGIGLAGAAGRMAGVPGAGQASDWLRRKVPRPAGAAAGGPYGERGGGPY